jgi:hypothetical protein
MKGITILAKQRRRQGGNVALHATGHGPPIAQGEVSD